MMQKDQAFSVSQINEYIKMALESNPVLGDVWLRGEISNFKSNYSSGHMYFSLKVICLKESCQFSSPTFPFTV